MRRKKLRKVLGAYLRATMLIEPFDNVTWVRNLPGGQIAFATKRQNNGTFSNVEVADTLRRIADER